MFDGNIGLLSRLLLLLVHCLLLLSFVLWGFVRGPCFVVHYLVSFLAVKYLTGRSKAVLLLWIFYVFVLSCVCCAFVCVCLYVLCGHLLGKD